MRDMVLSSEKLLGYIALRVGSQNVQVPICAAQHPAEDGRLATFRMEGKEYAIVVQEVPNRIEMQEAVERAAEDALRELSRKLLN